MTMYDKHAVIIQLIDFIELERKELQSIYMREAEDRERRSHLAEVHWPLRSTVDRS